MHIITINLHIITINYTWIDLSIWKTLDLHTIINLKFLLQLGMINSICLMDRILILDIQGYFEYVKKHETIADNPLVEIYENKIKNRIVFKINTGYKLELLSPETIKLLGSMKKDNDKNKNGEDVPKLQSLKVVLVHLNLVNNIYQQASKVLFTSVSDKQFG